MPDGGVPTPEVGPADVDPVARLVAEIAAARTALERAAESGRERAVHRARRALKRAKSLVAVLATVIGPDWRSRRRDLRDCGRDLSAARDADVLLKRARALGPDTERLVARLSEEAELAHRVAPPLAGIAARLAVAEAEAARLPQPADPRALLAHALADAYRASRADMKAVIAGAGERRFHDWRKRVKHRAFLTRLVGGPGAAEDAEALDRLGDLLGDDRDDLLLAERLARDPEAAGGAGRTKRLRRRLKARRAAAREQALALARALHALRPKHFARRRARP